MQRMTRLKDKYPCRINDCPAEEWIEEITGILPWDWEESMSVCDNCPFEKYINLLAEYEDAAESNKK